MFIIYHCSIKSVMAEFVNETGFDLSNFKIILLFEDQVTKC